MTKGVTPVIAIILILLVTISITGLAFTFLTRSQSEISRSVENETLVALQSKAEKFSVENVAFEKVYIRNRGIYPLSGLTFYVGGQKLNPVDNPVIQPGTVGIVILNLSELPEGYVDLNVIGGFGAKDSKNVLFRPICGNATCDFGETCANCPADCGICPASCTLDATPLNGDAPLSGDLTWSTTGSPSSCDASGNWSGLKSETGGTEPYGPVSADSLYNLTCTGPGGTVSCSVTVVINKAPTCALDAAPPNGTEPLSGDITWTTTDAPVTCDADGNWSGSKSETGGTEPYGPLNVNSTFNLTCTNAYGTGFCSVNVSVLPGQPAGCVLDVTPPNGTSPLSGTLDWTTSFSPATCTASDGWSGAKDPVSGTEPYGPVSANTTYNLSCTNAYGTGNCSAVVKILTTPSAPTCMLGATPPNGTAPLSGVLDWTTSFYPATCTASGGWSGAKNNISGSQAYGPLVVNTTYNLSCTNAYGTGNCSAVVTVVPVPPAPTCTLNAAPPSGDPPLSGNLTWTTAGSPASCTASGGWSGSKSTSGGTQAYGPLVIGTTYNLSCTNAYGTGNCSAAVAVREWYSASWPYRKLITFDPVQIINNKTIGHRNFSALVRLPSDANLAARAQPSGNDIMFTNNDSTVKLFHEIEKYDSTTGELVAWVKIFNISGINGMNKIYMYYGNSSVPNQQNLTGMWDWTAQNPVRSVWHMSDVPGSAQSVTWTSAVNVAVTENNLTKNGGSGTAFDAGAVSTQTIPSGSGYVESRVTETNKYRAVGLGNGNTDAGYADIDYGIVMLTNATIDVIEDGTDRGTFGPIVTGDILRTSVEAGTIRYYRNEKLLYTSGVAATYPFLVDTSFYSSGATINNSMIVTNSSKVFLMNESGQNLLHFNTFGSFTPAQSVPGVAANAVVFDGANDYLVRAHSSQSNPASGLFFVSAWVKTTSSNAYIVYKNSTNSIDVFYLAINNGKANFFWRTNVVSELANATGITNVNDGNWHYIVGVRNATRMGVVYVDGIPEGVDDFPSGGTNVNTNAPLWVGHVNGSSYINGLIDDVRLGFGGSSTSTAPDPGRVKTEYNNYRPGSTFVTLGSEEPY